VVVRAVLHALGMQEEAVFAASFPFAGGFGLRQETCGAVVGGAMCLGMASKKYGRPWNEFNTWDFEGIIGSMNSVSEFYERCKEAMEGTVICREITGMEIKSLEDGIRYAESPAFERCCVNCGKVARIVVETLLE
jgi:hypothetical protein